MNIYYQKKEKMEKEEKNDIYTRAVSLQMGTKF